MKKSTAKEFINKANLVHNSKYDYSLVEYINTRTKVKIICPEHGVFEQTPNNHITKGVGCSKCSNKYQYTTEEYIEKAKKVHGNKYDYSLVNYINNKTKIKIICPEHGVVEQLPNAHLNTSGCTLCAKNSKYNLNKFIEKARKIHGNKYDYSHTEYIRMDKRVNIICPQHGLFKQFAVHHLNGKNCPACAGYLPLSVDGFIKKANQIHNNKYDYSLIKKYKNNKTKVKIICPEHGVFKQVVSSHLQGHGCPICNESKGEKNISNYLIKNNIKFERQYKFNDCKNKRSLPFDFYIPKNNILIEYDGEQHFKSKEFFGGDDSLKYIKHNDKIKTKYCINNNIKLIRIKYNENINDKLKILL